ncbi:MAG: GNAT family N-acetyltransferase [Candidatus Limnocylindrales bacterium]
MTTEIRPIHDDELVAWLESVTTGFLDRPDVARIADEVRPHWDLTRNWAALDDGRVVGTTRTWPTELTLPGSGSIKASAISGVTVQPTHRRRGLLRGMLRAEHAAARDRDEVASLLYASEYPIYGRFGYGPAVQVATWTVDVGRTDFHATAGGETGSVEFVPVDPAAGGIVRDVFDAWRRTQSGEIWRRPVMYEQDLGLGGASWGDVWKGFLVAHRDAAGAIDGYARYHVEQKWEHRQAANVLVVDDTHGLTGDARVGLLRFLASVDLVTSLKIERRTPTDPLPWLLTNGRATWASDVGDGMWVKLHDIPAALEARSYERSGSVVLEVIDRDATTGDGASGRVRIALDASPDGARAGATDRSPDLTLDGAALGAAYLGGTRLRNAVLAQGWDEHRAGALAEAEDMLATRDAPWCSTFF